MKVERSSIARKIAACEAGLDTDPIIYYISLMLEKGNSREQLLKKLQAFFSEKTQEFVDSVLTPAPAPAPRKKGRCRFWPDCSNGDRCEYFHPTEEPKKECNKFPNCPFGDNCRFMHPTLCRFDAKCTRADCKYFHLSKKSKTSA